MLKNLCLTWKVLECTGCVMLLAWLIWPYPYTWVEVADLYPGLQYGALIPAAVYVWLRLRKTEGSNLPSTGNQADRNSSIAALASEEGDSLDCSPPHEGLRR